MYTFIVLKIFAVSIAAIGAALFLRKTHRGTAVVTMLAGVILYVVAATPFPMHFAMPPWMHSEAPGHMPTSISFSSALAYFGNDFEHIDDIGADLQAVPARTLPDADGVVRVALTAKEVIADIAPGISFNYWTYNGSVPGPMLRIQEGDTVELALTNDATSLHHHNIDLHAVTGPGGGASLTDVQPGETKTFSWKALAPGLYVYHCAMANVSVHNTHGQYGLILVEPTEGLAPVDKEFYLMQGELYTTGPLGARGLQLFDSQAVLDGNPNYVTFNGRIEDAPRMHAEVGDRIRMYVGNGGVNLVSSLHVIGEIFDQVYVEGGIGAAPLQNIQTTIVPAGGATIVEFTVDVPGRYTVVDHALARMNKGAWAVIDVTGPEQPDIYSPVE